MRDVIIRGMIRSYWKLHLVNNTMARTMDSRSECHGTVDMGLPEFRVQVLISLIGDLIIQRLLGATGELDCFSAYIRLKELDKSKDKV
ncbi:hypothetical protein GW17_00023982, partial [Ensete ventricosum]